MKASKISNSLQTHNHKPFDSPANTINTPTNLTYEPNSVLDSHLTSSPAAGGGGPGLAHFHPSSLPPPSDDWDPLSFFLSSDTTEAAAADFYPFDLPDIDLDPAPLPSVFDRAHLDLLLKAAAAVESNDVETAHGILSRLSSQIRSAGCSSSPLQRAAFHFKDALLSLLPVQNPPTPFPAVSPLEIVNRITAHKTFSDLSPVPQFTSFTANQTILESLLDSSSCSAAQSLHIIDFDIGLGGQWSSFAQEISARSKSLRSPPPHIQITAVVPDESVETVLAAENLRDFSRAIGVHLTVSFVHVGNFGTLALGRVRVAAGEAVAVVLTPTIFRLVGGTPESSAALLRFVRRVSPRVVVFVDTECFGSSPSFRRSFASALEYYSSVFESVDAAAAAAGGGREVEAAVRRVEDKVMRPRIFGAVAGWAPREGGWRETLHASGMAPAGFSEFTESQAEWLLRRAPVEGFHVARQEWGLVLSWRGRELAATSAWRC